MMNLFRIFGDGIHLFSFVLLLFKIWINGSSAGVSGKTQTLLALVFCTRYLDLFTTYISTYNTDMKIIFICLSFATVISIYLKFRETYEHDVDSFPHVFLIAAALFLALAVNYKLEFLEVWWAFSIYLEAVAAWPQFFMIYKTKKVLTSVFFYLLALGVYRILYIFNWIYRYLNEFSYRIDLIVFVSGIVQAVPYVIFWGCCIFGVVVITSKDKWFKKNLQHNVDQKGIFTITVQENNEKANDKLPLITSLEDMASPHMSPVQNV